MTTIVATPGQVITVAQYEAFMAPPPKLPTISELFDASIAFWTSNEMGTESELRRLAEFIPADTPLVPGRFPFVIVPARPAVIDWNKFMRLVLLGDKSGKMYLDAAYLTDVVTVPAGAYLMLDVEDGRARLNTKPSLAAAAIQKDGRSGYTAFEGPCHAAVLPVLTHHNMDLVGSRFSSSDWPGLYRHDVRPALDHGSDNAYPQWGAPSSRERRGL
jgi:hypothetical protein